MSEVEASAGGEPRFRVLIFPAGAENALEIYDALRYRLDFTVYGASGKAEFAEFRYPDGHYIEGDFYINRPDFDDVFESVIQKYNINLVIPTHDSVAL